MDLLNLNTMVIYRLDFCNYVVYSQEYKYILFVNSHLGFQHPLASHNVEFFDHGNMRFVVVCALSFVSGWDYIVTEL